jgi:predicted MFS family arabinose efflux permease
VLCGKSVGLNSTRNEAVPVAAPVQQGQEPAVALVVAGFAISFVLVGGGIDTVSVFLNAIAESTDWTRSQLSLAVSVGALCGALSTPLVGMAVDRFGIRVPMTVGVLFIGVGFAVLLRMTAPWHFIAANAALGIGFTACALLPITIAITVLVPQRTALALGIVAAGASAGALMLAPTLQFAVDTVGWRGAYVALGAAAILTPLPFLLFTLPRGRLKRISVGHTARGDPSRSLIGGLRRPGVAPLAGIMVLPGFTAFAVSVHLVPYLTGAGHGTTVAASALGATIGVSAFGKVAGGYLADRYGALPTVRLLLLLWALAIVLLARAESFASLAGFVVFYGLALGTHVAVVPLIARGIFGTERFGTLFGVLQLGSMLAAAAGPILSGVLFDATGSYGSAVLVWLAAMVAATLLAFFMRRLEDSQPAAPAPVVV